MKSIALIVSIMLIVALVYFLSLQLLDGCAEMTDGRVGVLKQDLEVGLFDTNETLFILPKGLIVREASATGADWFEPYRFRIVVTANNERFVDYEPSAEEFDKQDGEFYSAEVSTTR